MSNNNDPIATAIARAQLKVGTREVITERLAEALITSREDPLGTHMAIANFRERCATDPLLTTVDTDNVKRELADSLTLHEREIYDLICEGLSYIGVAARLNISVDDAYKRVIDVYALMRRPRVTSRTKCPGRMLHARNWSGRVRVIRWWAALNRSEPHISPFAKFLYRSETQCGADLFIRDGAEIMCQCCASLLRAEAAEGRALIYRVVTDDEIRNLPSDIQNKLAVQYFKFIDGQEQLKESTSDDQKKTRKLK